MSNFFKLIVPDAKLMTSSSLIIKTASALPSFPLEILAKKYKN